MHVSSGLFSWIMAVGGTLAIVNRKLLSASHNLYFAFLSERRRVGECRPRSALYMIRVQLWITRTPSGYSGTMTGWYLTCAKTLYNALIFLLGSFLTDAKKITNLDKLLRFLAFSNSETSSFPNKNTRVIFLSGIQNKACAPRCWTQV